MMRNIEKNGFMLKTFLWYLGACSRFCYKELDKKNAEKLALGVFLCFLALPVSSFANDPEIVNITLLERDTSAKTIKCQFDISWDNSWRDGVNYDAVWIFLKYGINGIQPLYHATLKTAGLNPAGFSRGSGTALDILVPPDKKGCFLQRSTQGSGSVSTTGVQLLWDYGQDGLSDTAVMDDNTTLVVFAIEMVYIPEGSFYAGDGSPGTAGEFEFGGKLTSAPGIIESEGALLFGEDVSKWYYNSDGGGDDASSGAIFQVSEAFPKGYAAFYAMKYEISEYQYVLFHYFLTSAEQTTRDITDASGKNSDGVVDRNYYSFVTYPDSTRPYRACSYLSWMDIAAYADWAALRPLSELEYEKMARGPVYPTNKVYAWGDGTATVCSVISGAEAGGEETCSTANANVNYNNTTFTGGDGGSGPLRSGIFATASTTTRAASGAGYYGNMDLSGNLWERVVTLGNAAGRRFSGTHGDGVLTTKSSYEGNATNPDWPGLDATDADRGITGASGSGLRGGGWSQTTASYMEISNRSKAGTTDASRGKDYGGRLARTAP